MRRSRLPWLLGIVTWIAANFYCLLQMTMALWVTKSRCKSCTFRWVKYSNCWVFKGGVFLPIIIETACLTGKMKQPLQTIFLKWSSSCINAEWFSRNELQRSKNERKWMRESAIKRKAFISKEQCQNSTRIWDSSAEYVWTESHQYSSIRFTACFSSKFLQTFRHAEWLFLRRKDSHFFLY